jgi:hypothetical protein
VEVDNENTFGKQISLFAPVGLDISWGTNDCLSLGVFASVIDLGALASFRESTDTPQTTDDGTIESTPQIGLRQVLAPGLYFVLGIDRFTIGAGASMTPLLRRIEDNGMLVEEVSAVRFGVFTAVDVTLFPF